MTEDTFVMKCNQVEDLKFANGLVPPMVEGMEEYKQLKKIEKEYEVILTKLNYYAGKFINMPISSGKIDRNKNIRTYKWYNEKLHITKTDGKNKVPYMVSDWFPGFVESIKLTMDSTLDILIKNIQKDEVFNKAATCINAIWNSGEEINPSGNDDNFIRTEDDSYNFLLKIKWSRVKNKEDNLRVFQSVESLIENNERVGKTLQGLTSAQKYILEMLIFGMNNYIVIDKKYKTKQEKEETHSFPVIGISYVPFSGGGNIDNFFSGGLPPINPNYIYEDIHFGLSGGAIISENNSVDTITNKVISLANVAEREKKITEDTKKKTEDEARKFKAQRDELVSYIASFRALLEHPKEEFNLDPAQFENVSAHLRARMSKFSLRFERMVQIERTLKELLGY